MGTYPYLKPDTTKVLRRALINGIILPPGDAATRQRLLGKFLFHILNLSLTVRKICARKDIFKG